MPETFLLAKCALQLSGGYSSILKFPSDWMPVKALSGGMFLFLPFQYCRSKCSTGARRGIPRGIGGDRGMNVIRVAGFTLRHTSKFLLAIISEVRVLRFQIWLAKGPHADLPHSKAKATSAWPTCPHLHEWFGTAKCNIAALKDRDEAHLGGLFCMTWLVQVNHLLCHWAAVLKNSCKEANGRVAVNELCEKQINKYIYTVSKAITKMSVEVFLYLLFQLLPVVMAPEHSPA